jgi:hypothetical protein
VDETRQRDGDFSVRVFQLRATAQLVDQFDPEPARRKVKDAEPVLMLEEFIGSHVAILVPGRGSTARHPAAGGPVTKAAVRRLLQRPSRSRLGRGDVGHSRISTG